MSDSDEDSPSLSAKTSEYPTYEIDCNLETLMAIKPPLSVLLHPPEYTEAQVIIEGKESPLESVETDSTFPGTETSFQNYSRPPEYTDTQIIIEGNELPSRTIGTESAAPEIPFEIYSGPLDEDGAEEEFIDRRDRGIVPSRTEQSGAFADSEDNISDNSLDDLLDPPSNFEEGHRNRLPDILDNLAGVQSGASICRCVGDYVTMAADMILIRSPDEEQNRSTGDYQLIQKKEDNEDGVKGDENPRNDFTKTDDSVDSQGEYSQDELTFGEYGFSDLDFEGQDLITQELRMKYPMRCKVPKGTRHLELTKEERQMMIDEMLLLRRDTIKGNRRHSWTSNINLDLDLEDCKSLIVRKCSTGLDLPPKVNLYSENIVKEEETTEHVDRGSIADLARIKKHWEERFELEEPEKKPEKKAKGFVRHWSVRLPKGNGKTFHIKDGDVPEVVNRNIEKMTAINDDYNENESAIEREIRWAMEREEMLRQEQEQRKLRQERLALEKEEQEQHNGVQTQQIIEHYENTDKEKFKPTYHEMTEADLGLEIAKKEAMKEQEMREQKELALLNGESITSDESGEKMGPTPSHYRETVVQMEIRLQREREAQFKEQQKLRSSSNKVVENKPVTKTTEVIELIADSNDNPPPPVSVPAPSPPPDMKTVAYKHGAESKIAQELEEAKAREEEFRQRLKESELKKSMSESVALNGNSRKNSIDDLENSVKSLDLEESVMSVSSESNNAVTTSGKTNTFINETPIDREIRLAREREDEYRRQQGYPASDKLSTQRSIESKTDIACKPKLNFKNKPVKGDTMKKIAASRLQQEIKQERSREVTLRESGRINTTSDETAGEQMKYKEVSEGPVKRNFITRKNSVPKVETDESQMDMDSSTKGISNSQKKNAPNYIIKTQTISATFSFREARSNAGSLIEQELKEMREREEELKKQREYIQNKANNNETSE